MSHDEEESEGGYPDISRKYLYPAEGGRIRLTSPRFKSALLEVGVVIDELYELPEDKFMRPGGDAEIARQEWEAYDDMRLEKVALVVEARRRLVRQGKGGGPRRSSKLLDNSSLLQLSKQQVNKVLTKREKKVAFEAAQASLFQKRQQHIIDVAEEKASKADVYRRQMKAEFEQWKLRQVEERRRMEAKTAEERAGWEARQAIEATNLLQKERIAAQNFERLNAERKEALRRTAGRRLQAQHEAQQRAEERTVRRRAEAVALVQQQTVQGEGWLRDRAALDGVRRERWTSLGLRKEEKAQSSLAQSAARAFTLEDERRRSEELHSRSLSRMAREERRRLAQRGAAREARLDEAARRREEALQEFRRAKTAEFTFRSSRALANREHSLGEATLTLRVRNMTRTDRARRLQRAEEHRKTRVAAAIKAKTDRMEEVTKQQKSLTLRRERSMHELFLTEQRAAYRRPASSAA